jgi:hypothetical protein
MDYRSSIWSVLLWAGVIVSAVAALADPSAYGIPASWMPYIRLGGFIAAVVGGKLGISYLPKADPK